MKLSSHLQSCAAEFLEARGRRQAVLAQAEAIKQQFIAAEKALIDAILNEPSEDSEDGSTALVHDGRVIRLPEEYWDRAPGEMVAVERLMGGGQ